MDKTYTYQDLLPSLPLPSLNNTKAKLKEWIAPLVNEAQFGETTAEIERFFSFGGEAEILQQKLQEWKKQQNGNWLAPLWNDLYLQHRDSLPVTSNFNVLLQPNEEADLTVAEIAGKVSTLVAEFYHSIVDETLEPVLQRGQPLDMSQYKSMFRSVRIPRPTCDEFYVAELSKENNYIVLIYKNRIYKIPVTDGTGMILDKQAIASAIEDAVFSNDTEAENVSIFTTAEREVAAEIYDELTLSEVNVNTLNTIADALVVISIDEESQHAEDAIKNVMLHPTNKYFDKTIQIAITQEGQIGFNVEHSAVDGTSMATVIHYISNQLAGEQVPNNISDEYPTIEQQFWDVTDQLKERLEQIGHDYVERAQQYALLPKLFTDFGAEQIKALNISPDAFFHIALQLAQYRTYGEFKSVYEPVSVRFFAEGRTECARATSLEKRYVVEAIESGQESNDRLYALLQMASDAHAKRIGECQRGLGIERHLYGLEQMYYRYGEELGIETLPAVFTDEGYKALRYDFISTSGMPYESAMYRMFAPATEDGHGLAYFLTDDMISINISSYLHNEINGNLLKNNLIEALQQLRAIALAEQAFEIA